MSEDNSDTCRHPSLATIGEMVCEFLLRIEKLSAAEMVKTIGVETDSASNDRLVARVRALVEQLIGPSEYGVRSHAVALSDQHLYAHQLDDAPFEPVHGVLLAIKSVRATGKLHKNGGPIEWERLVEAACVYSQLDPTFITKDEFWRAYPRQFVVGQAALRLRNRGYRVVLGDKGPSLDDLECARLVARLESIIASAGGVGIIRKIFSTLLPRYDPSMERFHLIREERFGVVPEPDIPFGYLLALAAKHLNGEKAEDGCSEAWGELVPLAADFAAIHDLREGLSTLFNHPSPAELPALLAKRALWDSFYTFPQLRRFDANKILRGVLFALPVDKKYRQGWALGDLFLIIDHLYSCVSDTNGPQIVNIQRFCRSVRGVGRALAKSILLEVFCHSGAGPNKYFRRPTDLTVRGADPFLSSGNNLHFRPVARLGNDCFIILDRSIMGPAIVESVLSAMRSVVGDSFQSVVVGPGLEYFVRRELMDHGIVSVSGDYDTDVHGECDVVIEAGERLAFIELKAKALTRDANAGSDVAVTLSLAASVIQSQKQAMGHEIELRRNGALTLIEKDQDKSCLLHWRKQAVDRISLGIFDFGTFQDKTIVAQLLSGVIGARYEVIDENLHAAKKKDFKKLNETINQLSQHLIAWEDMGEERVDAFSRCWFMSVPQLLLLLEDVEGPDDFFRNLGMVRRLTFQTFNFYFEYGNARKMYRERSKNEIPVGGL